MAKRKTATRRKKAAAPQGRPFLKTVVISAWTGICFGVATAVLILVFSSKLLANLVLFSVIYILLCAALLAAGIVGFNLSTRIALKKKASRKRKR